MLLIHINYIIFLDLWMHTHEGITMATQLNPDLTLFVMIDGLRPDVLTQASCPTLAALINRGASTLTASSIMPSVTLPCHTSIFHSVPPTRHGITSNDWHPMARPLPGLFDVVEAARKRSVALYNWEPLRDLGRPGTLDASYFRKCATDAAGDDWITEMALHHLTNYVTDFAFIYYGTVDEMGHKHGWMSDGYLRQVERVDRSFGQLLTELPESIHLLAQADHGGHERSHGTEMSEDMTVPWIIAGPQIRQNYQIQQAVSLLDTAPTLARLLNLSCPKEWEGSCVDEVFIEG